jgi:hypothetical protein
MGNISRVADGAYFVPSYSTQIITTSYDTQTTIQSLGSESHEILEDVSAVGIAPPPTNDPSIGASQDAPAAR